MSGQIKYTLNATSFYTESIESLSDLSVYLNVSHAVTLNNSVISYIDSDGDEIYILDENQFKIARLQNPEILKLRIQCKGQINQIYRRNSAPVAKKSSKRQTPEVKCATPVEQPIAAPAEMPVEIPMVVEQDFENVPILTGAQACELYDKISAKIQRGIQSETQNGADLLAMAKAYYYMGNFYEANEFIAKAFAAKIASKDLHAQCLILHSLVLDTENKQPELKYENLITAYKVAKKDYPDIAGYAMLRAAQFRCFEGNCKAATKALKLAHHCIQNGEANFYNTIYLWITAYVLFCAESDEQECPSLEDALVQARQLEFTGCELEILYDIGYVQWLNNQYRESAASYASLLVRAEELECQDLRAFCHFNLGFNHTKLKHKGKATEHYTKALELRQAIYEPDHVLVKETLAALNPTTQSETKQKPEKASRSAAPAQNEQSVSPVMEEQSPSPARQLNVLAFTQEPSPQNS